MDYNVLKTSVPIRMAKGMPYKLTRLNLTTGIKEEHYYTENELARYKETGKIILDENAEWKVIE